MTEKAKNNGNFPPLSYNPLHVQTRAIDAFRITMDMFDAYLSYLCSRYSPRGPFSHTIEEDPPYQFGEAFLPGRPRVQILQDTHPVESRGEMYTYTLTLPVLALQMERPASHPREGGYLRLNVHFFLRYDLPHNLVRLEYAEITHESYGFTPPLSLQEVWGAFLDRYGLLLGHAHPDRNSLVLFDPRGVRLALTHLLNTLQSRAPNAGPRGGETP